MPTRREANDGRDARRPLKKNCRRGAGTPRYRHGGAPHVRVLQYAMLLRRMSEPQRKGKAKPASEVRGRIAADIVFFDNDGTLFDSRIGVISAVQDAFREFCARHGFRTLPNSESRETRDTPHSQLATPNSQPLFPIPTAERILELTGQPAGYFYSAILPEGYQHLADELRELSLEHEKRAIAAQGKLFEGAEEVLAELRRRGKKLVLMTHAGGDYASAIVEKFGYRERFDLIMYVGKDGLRDKKEMIARAMKELGVSPADSHAKGMVVVGDKLADMEAAKHHGAVAILAGYGFGGEKERKLADFVVSEPREILEIVE